MELEQGERRLTGFDKCGVGSSEQGGRRRFGKQGLRDEFEGEGHGDVARIREDFSSVEDCLGWERRREGEETENDERSEKRVRH